MKLLGEIKNGTLTFPPAQYALRQQWLTSLKDGQRVAETLVRRSDPKTQQQLGYHFGVIVAMMKVCFEERGIDLFGCAPTVRFTKEILYNACAEKDDEGRLLTLSKMDKTQVADFIDRCLNWCSTELGLYIPPADKDWRDKRNEVSGVNDNGQEQSD